jgi:hypothetical protein
MFMSLSTPRILPAVPRAVNDLVGPLAAVICAASAGIHAMLVPSHVTVSTLLAAAFALDAVLLGAAAVLVNRGDLRDPALHAVAGLLAATALAYVLSRSTGLPLLAPGAEPVDVLGAVTTFFELVGAVACMLLTLRREPR